MNGLDLFSGIGGLTKALEGYVRPVAYCELDGYCRGVLLSRMADKRLPTAPIWDDVRTLRGFMFGTAVDIIYGGFPCQDISIAGRRKGLEGERSGLFFEIVRLAKEIEPKFIFLENVPGIRTKGLARVVEELSTLRYDLRWGMLAAQDVGANHKRERWFLLAHVELPEWRPSDTLDGGMVREGSLSAGRQEIAGRLGISGANVADADVAGCGISMPGGTPQESRAGTPQRSSDWWQFEPNVGRVAHGIPKRVDRLRALGNAIVPAQAREAFERLMGLK